MSMGRASGCLRTLAKPGERASDLFCSLDFLKEQHVVDRQGKERVGLGCEVGDAILDRSVHDRIGVEFVRNRLVVSFEHVLVDATVFVKELQRGFKPFRESVNRSTIKALEIK